MRTIGMGQAITEALDEEMARDPEVFLLGEDIGRQGGTFGTTKGLFEKYGADRVLDTPIAEEAIVGAALGAALLGGRPVAEIMFNDFTCLAMDQIVNQAAKIHYMSGGGLSAPMVIRTMCGNLGAAGAQHSQSLEAWFTHVPGLKVVAPSSPEDAKGLLKAAIRDPDPVIFFEQGTLYNIQAPIPDEVDALPLGSGRVVVEGSDVTIATYMKGVHQAVRVAESLRDEGISVEVWDARTLVPFDREGLRASLERTGRLVVVHEAVTRSGFGAEIVAIVAEEWSDLLKAPARRVGAKAAPVPFSPILDAGVLPSEEWIADAVRATMGRGRST